MRRSDLRARVRLKTSPQTSEEGEMLVSTEVVYEIPVTQVLR